MNRATSKLQDNRHAACGFCSTLFCASKDGKWYVTHNTKDSSSLSMHKNHHQVNSNDLPKHKNELSKPVLYQIKSLCKAVCVACQAIISMIEKEFGEVVSSSTFNSEQKMELDNLYDQVSKIPHGESADRLIALFQAMSNTSYAYVKHDVDSGFVTYNKPTSSKHATASTVELAKTLKEEWLRDVQKVRQSLKLDGSNKMLIAWSHDEEVRKAKLFPEYIAADTTFGVNRQRRNLFVCCIPDGRNKVFTIMRCFMPSKQMAAYVWPIAYALPYLVGVENTRRVSCISTDAEKALVDAINIATNRNHFSNVKHRLDFYHHFTQVWEDNCTPRAHHSEKIKDVLNELRHWIKSWYTKLESKDEHDFSKTKFDSYLQVHSQMLGRDLLKGVEKCVQNFEKDINCVSYWNFLFCTTLGFVGSSIVEIVNSGIKGGHNAVKATMTLEKSAHLQSTQIEEKKQKHVTQMAQGMNRNKLWTKSQTGDFRSPSACVQNHLVSFHNKAGTITNSNLKLCGNIAHHSVIAHLADVREHTIWTGSGNTANVSWLRKGSTTTTGAVLGLLRMQAQQLWYLRGRGRGRQQNQNRPNRQQLIAGPHFYCHTHGCCAHPGYACNNPAQYHQPGATFQNMMDGNNYLCNQQF